MDSDTFDRTVFTQGSLFYDEGVEGLSHTASAHLLQVLMITPAIDAEFGAGTTKKFLEYMGTSEGRDLWYFIFDRGPNYFADFRAPRAFNILNLAASHMSYLGLD